MKKLVQINIVCNGSTGKIMCDIAKEAEKKGFESYIFYGRGNSNKELNCIKIGNKLSVYFHVLITRLFNKHGHGSYFVTKKLVGQLKKINPDIIHLHNIHGYYINIKILFKYLKKEYKGKIIWTLHDCWTFTGHCSYFTAIDCKKWKSKCFNCPQIKSYPKSWFFDSSKKEQQFKKKQFSNIPNLTIITVSKWLEELVKQSFLNKYTVKTISNGIDLNVFKPIYDEKIKVKYNIPKNKKILLGVSNIWEKRKGLDIFIKLSTLISNNYIIVLVGLTKNQISNLPKNIVGIERTDNQNELVKLYSVADVFVNPSLEETFSLVTIEAMACGTPAVVCNTSAVKDLIVKNVGLVIDKHEAKDYLNKINLILDKDKKYYKNDLKTHVLNYTKEKSIKNYISIYRFQGNRGEK